ncbi:hypothetical protein [Mucilaginibacter aquariorum]|uniref:DUF4138 domain-containing protein n=1 Tax=Mucilaginibacter aquariorum TaxID=2967225 RepID=A0ABT1SZE9_9SPHI|nr:hypothetical protein [Mucilaginibacter aquariorum]MCQ6957730.1 hypothetical protein [Mucilaginibacter aquariorum]
MKKALIISFLLFSFLSQAQQITKHLAYRQTITSYQNKVIKLSYSKKYLNPDDSVFITKYTVYNISGKPYVYINANHNKKNRHITVDVVDAHGGIFSHIHTEEYDYQEPTEKYFGISGSYRALGGDKYPYQLSLYFPDAKHERVNVVITNATDYKVSNSPYVAYTLKDEMLPSKPPILSNGALKTNQNIKNPNGKVVTESSKILPDPLDGLKRKVVTTKLNKAEIFQYYLVFHEKSGGENHFYLPALSDGSDSCILVQLEKKGNLYLLKFSNQCD